MKKKYYLIALLIVTFLPDARSQETMTERISKAKAVTSLSRNLSATIQECRRIADAALKEKPSPVKTISSEGRLKGDPVKAATVAAIRDFKKTYALAIAYKVTGNQEYLKKASEFMLAWAHVNQSEGNPINDTNLDMMIDAYDLIGTSLPGRDANIIVRWLRNTADAEIKSIPLSKKKEIANNNWNSHRLKIIGQIGYAIKEPSYQEFVISQLKTQLERNLLPEGSSIDFKLRDALHYHVYNLEPLLKLAIVIKQNGGGDFYSYQTKSGSSLKKSVKWLVPYLNGVKSHQEYVHSTVAFDRKRAENGEAAYQTGVLFKPEEGLKTLALAIYFDQSYDQIYRKIKGSKRNESDWQLLYQMMKASDFTEK